MSNIQEQFDSAAEQWLRNHRYSADARVLSRIANRVRENLEQLGGDCAAASFERAYLELVSEKVIKPFRGTVSDHVAAEAPAIPQNVADFIEHGSAFEQRKRYASDPAFRKYYDTYAKSKQNVAQEQGVFSLTAEEYHRIPSAQIAHKYRTDQPRGFKSAVDKLIADGKI